MAGPLQMYLYVHDSILRAVAGYEERAKDLDPASAEEVTAFGRELDWFHSMVKAHEHAEEEVVFPALNDRFRFVAETYAFDHDDFEPHVFDGIDRALTGLQRPDGRADQQEMSDLLRRQTIALHEHMRLHITKENELLVPKLESEFDVDEQVGMAAAMAGLFEPPMMGALVGWMYDGQVDEDRAGMLRFLRAALPPEVFGGVARMLADRDAVTWAEMERRVPELAGPSEATPA